MVVKAALAGYLSLTLAMRPVFFPPDSGPFKTDRRIYFLPEKVVTAELHARWNPSPCPCS